jgi:uncharacterized protein YcbX
MIIIKNIYRYPIKGLSAEALLDAYLQAGKSLKDDRRFAIALGSTNLDLGNGGWMAKNYFLMQAKNPKLTQLETKYDPGTQTLKIFRNGKIVSRGQLTTLIGRTTIENFLTAYMGDEARGTLKVFETQTGQMLSDQSSPLVSLINLASIRDISRITGMEINPIRFRGNINFECTDPWLENDLVGRTLKVGTAMLKVVAPVSRCVATHINPELSKSDVNILKALQCSFGHTNCGIFAEVTQTGTIQINGEICVA